MFYSKISTVFQTETKPAAEPWTQQKEIQDLILDSTIHSYWEVTGRTHAGWQRPKIYLPLTYKKYHKFKSGGGKPTTKYTVCGVTTINIFLSSCG